MNTGERLFTKLAYGCAPLLVWAAHFTFLYGLAAAQCSPLLARAAPSAWLMWLASALAAALCLLMLWRANGALRGQAALPDVACAASALLALAAIAWTTLPLLLLDGCG